jgi:hypothetical protein
MARMYAYAETNNSQEPYRIAAARSIVAGRALDFPDGTVVFLVRNYNQQSIAAWALDQSRDCSSTLQMCRVVIESQQGY